MLGVFFADPDSTASNFGVKVEQNREKAKKLFEIALTLNPGLKQAENNLKKLADVKEAEKTGREPDPALKWAIALKKAFMVQDKSGPSSPVPSSDNCSGKESSEDNSAEDHISTGPEMPEEELSAQEDDGTPVQPPRSKRTRNTIIAVVGAVLLLAMIMLISTGKNRKAVDNTVNESSVQENRESSNPKPTETKPGVYYGLEGEPTEVICEHCGGTGKDLGASGADTGSTKPCSVCGGSGKVDGTRSKEWKAVPYALNLDEESSADLGEVHTGLFGYVHFTLLGPNTGSIKPMAKVYFPNGVSDRIAIDSYFTNNNWLWYCVGYQAFYDEPDESIMRGLSTPGTVTVEVYDTRTGFLIGSYSYEQVEHYFEDSDWALAGPMNSSKYDFDTVVSEIPAGQPVQSHFYVSKIGSTDEDTLDILLVKSVNGLMVGGRHTGKVIKDGDHYVEELNAGVKPGDKVEYLYFNAETSGLIGMDSAVITDTLSKNNQLPKPWKVSLTVNAEKDSDEDSKQIKTGSPVVCHYRVDSGPAGYSFSPKFKVYFTDGDIEEYPATIFISIGKKGWYTIVDEYEKDWGTGELRIEMYDRSTGEFITKKTIIVTDMPKMTGATLGGTSTDE